MSKWNVCPHLLFILPENESKIWLDEQLMTSNIDEPILKRHILDSSKLKEFADETFKFVENDRKLYKQVENTR